jgi:hypothetical protein
MSYIYQTTGITLLMCHLHSLDDHGDARWLNGLSNCDGDLFG